MAAAVTRRPRNSRAMAAAIATAATLGITAFTLPALAAAPSATPTLALTDSTLEWGLKESFRKYVTGIAAGTITPTDGATQADGNGVLTFPNGTGSYDPTTHALKTAHEGTVRFSSAAHGFDIKITDLKVVTSGTTGSIQADVTLNGATQDDIDLASIDLTGLRPETGEGSLTYKDIPATLTADGAKAFNGMYKEGTELDKATLSVKYATGGGTDPDPSDTPTDEPPTSEPPTSEPPTSEPPTSPPPSSGNPSPTPTGSESSGSASPSASASTSPSTPAAEDGKIVDGNLDWGLKESFRSYVVGPIANGKVELSGGATQSGSAYRFPKGTGEFDADAQTLDASFGGKVRFVGHETDGEYLLDLNLSGLQVKAAAGKAVLYADISTKDMTTHKVTTSDAVPFATLDLPAGDLAAKDGVLTLDAVPATLTADGSKAFSGMYTEGTALDPLTLAVSLGDGSSLPSASATPSSSTSTGSTSGGSTSGSTTGGSTTGGSTTGGTGGSLASTGSDVPVGSLLAGAGAIAAAGAAVVFAAKRRRDALDETA